MNKILTTFDQMTICRNTLKEWPLIRWLSAAIVAIFTFFIIGIPTAVVPNSFFGREIEVTSWSIPVLTATSILTGLLFATYINAIPVVDEQKSAKIGGVGAFLSYFAVGCPVCNKLALVALGSSGAIKYFAPVQPYLGAISIGLLFYVFRKRVLSEGKCKI